MIEKVIEKVVNESSLSRLWSHNDKHDCGAMTAFRKYDNCGYIDGDINEPCPENKSEPVLLSRKDNMKANLALASDLKSLGYNLTKIIGKYPEGGSTVKEVSYFIVDVSDKGTLEKDLKKLGEKYKQDSILFAPKGSVQNKAKAYLIGTNKCCNNWLDYGKKNVFEKGKMGYDSPIYTSYIHGRPFIFESCELSTSIFGSGTNAIMGREFAKEFK